eukprot:CAMPEP_0170737580 /NCGR_PEP_ID=MMETSP0437-20130122/4198_1 /TAXON_ID=0 /ORGANISM="Sexangularia sp." /LENGTH=550 /DNA_ID=CAMNT_0011075967 /DNA_START=9 /DNA_END=1662 /DNA_ORIENTATION=-
MATTAPVVSTSAKTTTTGLTSHLSHSHAGWSSVYTQGGILTEAQSVIASIFVNGEFYYPDTVKGNVKHVSDLTRGNKRGRDGTLSAGDSHAPAPPTIATFDPATGLEYGRLVNAGAAEVDAAVCAAKAAGPAWARTSRADRAALLNRLADLIDEHAEALAAAEARDCGKSVSFARSVDMARSAVNCRFFAAQVTTMAEGMSSDLDHDTRSWTSVMPVGVVGAIVPWNIPLYLLTWKVAPAVAYGNTIVLKPAEFTSITAVMFAGLVRQAGFPPGVFNLVTGTGASAGAPLAAHPSVSLITFTGGTVTGANVAMAAAPTFKKVSLELGGKNATIVFADANMDAAVAGASTAAFANQGEICLCGSRILVEASVHDEFVRRFVEQVRTSWRVGDPLSPTTNMGALVDAGHLEKVRRLLAVGIEEGATVAYDGADCLQPGLDSNGYYFTPHVLTNVTPTSTLFTTEVFGPVVTITPFSSYDEALALTNSSRYGLACSVWSESLSRTSAFARDVESAFAGSTVGWSGTYGSPLAASKSQELAGKAVSRPSSATQR